jgi:hypothetical protein
MFCRRVLLLFVAQLHRKRSYQLFLQLVAAVEEWRIEQLLAAGDSRV